VANGESRGYVDVVRKGGTVRSYRLPPEEAYRDGVCARDAKWTTEGQGQRDGREVKGYDLTIRTGKREYEGNGYDEGARGPRVTGPDDRRARKRTGEWRTWRFHAHAPVEFGFLFFDLGVELLDLSGEARLLAGDSGL
jgi:hypothetical protein